MQNSLPPTRLERTQPSLLGCPRDNRKGEGMSQEAGEQEQPGLWGHQLRIPDLCPGTGDILRAREYKEACSRRHQKARLTFPNSEL